VKERMSEDKNLIRLLKRVQERAENVQRYSDGLRENMIAIEELLDSFKAAGIKVTSDVILLVEPDNEFGYEDVWRFYYNKSGLYLRRESTRFDKAYVSDYYYMSEAPRRVLVAAVRALPAFVKQLADALAEKEGELKDAASLAERLRAAIASAIEE